MQRIWFIAHWPDLMNAMDDDIFYSYAEAKEHWDACRTIKGFERLRIFSAQVTVDEETVIE
mgnify:CR=1 FL=1